VDSIRAREPSWLAPGQSFPFERRIDCVFPLPGAYDVSVFARVGDDDSANPSSCEPVGSFRLEVEALPRVPKPVPSHPGVFAIMTGSKATRPMPPEAWTGGDYHVVVALINGSARSVALGAGKIAFLVYAKGSSIPCVGEARLLTLPGELAPGTMHLADAPITCAPSLEGKYEIVGYLSFADVDESIEIGRLGLRVTSDPKAFMPDPRSLGDRSGLSR
jgi:hypothetical protein